MTPEERYSALVEALVSSSGALRGADVDPSQRGFGSSGQRGLGGRIFAMRLRGRRVLKLPRQRVDVLVAAREGERFDPGKGRLMKEWLSLAPASELDWLPLARGDMQ